MVGLYWLLYFRSEAINVLVEFQQFFFNLSSCIHSLGFWRSTQIGLPCCSRHVPMPCELVSACMALVTVGSINAERVSLILAWTFACAGSQVKVSDFKQAS